MAKRSSPVSWTAVHKNREICLDLDVPPVPRGWERCLDLKSGLLYLKEMEQTGTGRQFHADRQKKINTPQVLDIFKPRRDSITITGLELKEGRKSHNSHCKRQNLPSKFTPQATEISNPTTQDLKRQKLLSIDESDGLSLQLSLSLPSGDSYSVKPQQCLQNGDKVPQHQLDLRSLASLQESQVESLSILRQNSILELDSSSSSPSRCSSSASSFSNVAEAGNHDEKRSTAEVESDKSKSSAAPEGKLSSHSLTKLMASGCPHCLMFVLLLKGNPSCPKCGSSIQLLNKTPMEPATHK